MALVVLEKTKPYDLDRMIGKSCDHKYINYTDIKQLEKGIILMYEGLICEISNCEIKNPQTGEVIMATKQEFHSQHDTKNTTLYDNIMYLIKKLCTTEIYTGEDLWHLTCCKFESNNCVYECINGVVTSINYYEAIMGYPSIWNGKVDIRHVAVRFNNTNYDEIDYIIDCLYKVWDEYRSNRYNIK